MTERRSAELNFQLISTSQPGSLSTFRTRSAPAVTAAGEVLYAIDGDGARHLLIPLSAADNAVVDRESSGVHILERTLIEENDSSRRFLDVACMAPKLERLFASVVDEMLSELESQPRDPGASCRAVLDRWRELLKSGRRALLGRSELIGILAELLLLERIAKESPKNALSSWKGWEQDRIDFIGREAAIEVKATAAREGRAAGINGAQQLDAPPGMGLFLLFSRFASGGQAATSLPDVVQRLIERGIGSTELFRRLATLGYDPADSEAYRELRFDLAEQLFFQVDESFPKVVPASFTTGSVPERVSNLRYSVDLSGITPLPEQRLTDVIRSFTDS